MRKASIYLLLAGAVTMTASCSSKNGGDTHETADRIEQARNAGREAARRFVTQRWEDTLALQQQLVEAAAERTPYDSLPQCREAYDSAFISTVRTVSPDVARELDSYKRNR